MIDPIKKTVTVPMSPAEAFRLFTQDLSLWWPVETHSLSAYSREKPQAVTVDPEAGEITETCADGSRRPWGKITCWDPASRLSLDWHVGRPAQEATQVDILFIADDLGTRVELTHAGFERLKDGETMAQTYNSGWVGVLEQRFGTYCRKQAA
jgi:uncharacterized protein YndB with AHSA1/START domain